MFGSTFGKELRNLSRLGSCGGTTRTRAPPTRVFAIVSTDSCQRAVELASSQGKGNALPAQKGLDSDGHECRLPSAHRGSQRRSCPSSTEANAPIVAVEDRRHPLLNVPQRSQALQNVGVDWQQLSRFSPCEVLPRFHVVGLQFANDAPCFEPRQVVENGRETRSDLASVPMIVESPALCTHARQPIEVIGTNQMPLTEKQRTAGTRRVFGHPARLLGDCDAIVPVTEAATFDEI